MTDPAEGLRALLDHPTSAPDPLEMLHRRVESRRRRRTRRRAAAAGLAAVAMSIAVVPLIDHQDDRPTRIAAGPGLVTGESTTTGADGSPTALPVATRLEYSLPEGWDTLYSEGMRLAVSTRPLTDRDRDLALLARADAAFSALPSDAVVLVVGSDPLEAKYGTSWDGTTVLPGPAFGLGAERVLPGGVRFRRGDVPQSMVQIAAYAGPEAPANRLREAEAVAAGIRVVSADGPPSSVPASGSGPSGTSPVAAQGLREVARAGSGGSSLVLEAGADCAYVRPAGSQPQLPGHDRLGGGCGARPTGGGIAPIGSVALVWGDPGTPPASASVMRVGSNVRTVSARTADGRTFAAVLGADGWGVAVGPGRIVGLTAVDAAGRQVEAFVP